MMAKKRIWGHRTDIDAAGKYRVCTRRSGDLTQDCVSLLGKLHSSQYMVSLMDSELTVFGYLMSPGDTRHGQERTPLVSCIMPTRDRKDFVMQSISYFERQEYPNRELLILDDSDKPLNEHIATTKSVRYFYLNSATSIGEKRNLGCHHARGVFIAQWDDDDWYGPQRLTKQIEPLLVGTCDISGLGGGTIFELNSWEFWESPYVRKVLEGTIVCRLQVWKELARYPNQSFGECGAFLADATRSGAILETIPSNELFLYVLHGGNTSTFDGRRYPQSWIQISEPAIFSSDRAFYLSRRSLNRECR